MIDPDKWDTGLNNDWDEGPDEELERIWKQEDQHYERYHKQRKNLKHKKVRQEQERYSWEKQQHQRQRDDNTDRTGNTIEGYMQWEDVSERGT